MKKLFSILLLFILANPVYTQKNKKPINSEIDITADFFRKGLQEFNSYQELIGNPKTILSLQLVEAAKRHAEYLTINHIETPMSLDWHNEEEGKKGFIGKEPKDQALAMGFAPSENYFVTNTMTVFTTDMQPFAEPEYLFHQMASTILHRSMIIGQNYEAIGFYKHKDPKTKLNILVFFGSQKIFDNQDRVFKFPENNQKGVPVGMLPEIPQPFSSPITGFPITVQLSSKDYEKNISLVSAEITDPKGKKLPVLTLTPETNSQAGSFAKSLKIISIATKGLLEPLTTYKVKMKVKDTTGKIILDEKWTFTTDDGKMKFLGIDFKDTFP